MLTLATIVALFCFVLGSREQRELTARRLEQMPLHRRRIRNNAYPHLTQDVNAANDTPRHPLLWFGAGILLVLLAINRDLGFLSMITNYFRTEAKLEGLYNRRRPLQRMLTRAIPVVGVAAFGVWLVVLRRSWRRYLPLMVALVYLVVYALIEGVSLHEVDSLLASRHVGLPMKTWGDVLGLILVAIAGAWSLLEGR